MALCRKGEVECVAVEERNPYFYGFEKTEAGKEFVVGAGGTKLCCFNVLTVNF